jgi:hypothetical protein
MKQCFQPCAAAGDLRMSTCFMPATWGAPTCLQDRPGRINKRGAISAPSGTLDVSCAIQDDEAVMVWTERGGPPVAAPPEGAGFGSKMVARSMSRQLGGSIAFDWSKEGVIITLRMKKDRLAA